MKDRSPVWIAFCDLVLAILAVVIVAVAPTKAKPGIEDKSWFLLTIEWPVDIDADADIHLRLPDGGAVFYGAHQRGCARLDQDNKGFQDNVVKLADGSSVKIRSDKETIQLRCVAPGHYDVAANLFAYRLDGLGQAQRRDLGLKVHGEIVEVNPSVRVVFAGDVTLDRVGQTVNFMSFDLDRDGKIALSDPPLAPVTSSYVNAPDP